MRNAFSLIVTALLTVVILVACGGGTPAQEATNLNTNSETQVDADTNTASVPEVEAEPQTVAETEAQPLLSIGRGMPVGVSYSPNGATLAVGVPGGVWLYDTTDFTASPRWLDADYTPLYELVYSADGSRMATVSRDGGVTVWDTATDTILSSFDTPTTTSQPPVALNVDGNIFAIVSSTAVRQYDVIDGFSLNLDLDMEQRIRHTNTTTNIAYSPDGQRLITTGGDKTVRVWDSQSHEELMVLEIDQFTSQLTSAHYSPDGTRISVFGENLSVLDSASGEVLYTVDIRGQEGSYSADGLRLAIRASHGDIFVLDTGSGETLFRDTYSSPVIGLGINAEGSQIVVATNNGAVHVRDAITGQEIAVLDGFSSSYSAVAFSPDGNQLATTTLENRINIWDVATGEAQVTIALDNEYRTYSIDYSADGTRILTGSNGAARIWDATSGEQILEITGHTLGITSAAYNPDSTRVVTGSVDRTVRLWDAENGTELQVIGAGVVGEILYVTFNGDGTRIATVSESFFDPTVHIWDASSGEQIAALDVPGARVVSFNPDSSRVVVGGLATDFFVTVWSIPDWDQVLSLQDQTAEVTDVAYSTNGTEIIASFREGIAFRDGIVRIWDANSGEELHTIESGSVAAIALSPDETRIAVGLFDGTVAIWQFPGR